MHLTFFRSCYVSILYTIYYCFLRFIILLTLAAILPTNSISRSFYRVNPSLYNHSLPYTFLLFEIFSLFVARSPCTRPGYVVPQAHTPTPFVSKVNMSSKASFEQLRSNLSGKPLVQFKPSRRADTSIDAGPFETANNAFATGGTAIDSNLLSPPLSVDSLDTPPFIPADSDQTSLSMKRRRQRRSRRYRDGLDRASTGDTDDKVVARHYARKRLASSSVPDLRHDAKSQPFMSTVGQLLMRQQMQALHVAHRRASNARSVGFQQRASLLRSHEDGLCPPKLHRQGSCLNLPHQ